MALENTHPQAEFVVVFDADFLPYPDTITQFLKYFQVTAGTLDFSPGGRTSPSVMLNSFQHPDAGGILNQVQNDTFRVQDDGKRQAGGKGWSNIAAVQGYQWHVLNKSENWITKGVRAEYAGSYVVERSGGEALGALKQIAGSVYMIRRDILQRYGWGTSITEDFELTLRLYRDGFKVVYTPYIQTPSECVSTLKRLVRQRMRWAEGHSHNIKKMFGQLMWGRWEILDAFKRSVPALQGRTSLGREKVWVPSKLTLMEKLEFLYLSPYYLQAAFFMLGTLSWFISEAVFKTRLPFWTSIWGWSLVFTNLFSLPLMNTVGLFLEESEERDYGGILSFLFLTYLVVPFQGYAALKGFLEKKEGPWFRTPKTGKITDIFTPGRFARLISAIFSGRRPASALIAQIGAGENLYRSLATAHNQFDHFCLKSYRKRWVGNMALSLGIAATIFLSSIAPFIPSGNSYPSQTNLMTVAQAQAQSKEQIEAQIEKAKNPENEEEIIKNALNQTIDTPRSIIKSTKEGKSVEFIFHQEPRVRVKLEHQEIEFETRTINGQNVNPSNSLIYKDKEAIYEEIIKDVDLKYTFSGDLLVEEFILKKPVAFEKVEQILKTVDLKVVSPDQSSFGFYSEDGRELFKFSQPFVKDAQDEVNNDLNFALKKETIGYKLTKTLGSFAKKWLADPNRAYPVIVDPSVIVSGGIAEEDVQFGGLQRKVAYVNGNWYAFYNDTSGAGISVFYKKSSDGTSWGSAVDMDSSDTDNYNPSISVSGNTIIVFWIDDSSDAVQGRTINTASADAQGTLCTSTDQGTLDLVSSVMNFMVTFAAIDTTSGMAAYSDTSSDTEVDIFYITGLGSTCTIADAQVDYQPPSGMGGTRFGSGITAGDRPVVVPISGLAGYSEKDVAMIFQDGNLSYSVFYRSATSTNLQQWLRNNLTIASITDDVYSVTTNGTKVWILTKSGTTGADLYSCCTEETNVDIDASTGVSAFPLYPSSVDIFCSAADDCKIVYTDDISSTGPDLVYVDCDNEDCSTSQSKVIDSDIGDQYNNAYAKIYCVATDNCKIVYGDNIGGSGPDQDFVDCNDAECSSPTITILDTDLGDASTPGSAASLYCPSDTNCKVVYWTDKTDDIIFIDCANADCSSQDTGSPATIDDNASGSREENAIFCPATDDCKVTFRDTEGTTDYLAFVDCGNEACSSSTQDYVDPGSSLTDTGVSPEIWCPASDPTDCKIAYRGGTNVYANSTALMFADCDAADCALGINGAPRIIVDAYTDGDISLSCLSTTDCKILHRERQNITAGGNISELFVDCDTAACTLGSTADVPVSEGAGGAVYCPATDNCKVAYIEQTSMALSFVDCDNEECFPTASDLDDPWSDQTNVTSVSLTYDSTNTDLYAHIIKDTDEKAYWKSTDATPIAWGGETDYGWSNTGDYLGQISAPETGAGQTQIGVVLRQGTNFEFATVPEKMFVLLILIPFLPKVLEKLKKRKIKAG